MEAAAVPGLLTPRESTLGHLLLSTAYVGSLYLFPASRLSAASNSLGRNDPRIVRARMKAVGGASVLGAVGVLGVVWVWSGEGFTDSLLLSAKLLGLPTSLSPPSPQLLKSLLLTPLLFAGPLVGLALDGDLPFLRRTYRGFKMSWWDELREIGRSCGSMVGLRNYLIAPITEELTFRSNILALSLLTTPINTCSWLIFGTPLWFGVAHVHHAIENFIRLGSDRRAALQALLACTFQTLYTTLFGSFASFLFLRTGSLLPPIASHITCNLFGFPDMSAFSRHTSWTSRLVLACAYAGGVAGFVGGLWRWTEVEGGLWV